MTSETWSPGRSWAGSEASCTLSVPSGTPSWSTTAAAASSARIRETDSPSGVPG